ASNVVWANSTSVYKLIVGAGTVKIVVGSQAGPWGIALLGTLAYWANYGNGSITYSDLSAGGGTALPQLPQQTAPTALAVDANNVYWINAGATGSLNKANRLDGTGSTPALVANLVNPISVAVYSGDVYWTSGSVSTGT